VTLLLVLGAYVISKLGAKFFKIDNYALGGMLYRRIKNFYRSVRDKSADLYNYVKNMNARVIFGELREESGNTEILSRSRRHPLERSPL
jgi:hypothetical protein